MVNRRDDKSHRRRRVSLKTDRFNDVPWKAIRRSAFLNVYENPVDDVFARHDVTEMRFRKICRSIALHCGVYVQPSMRIYSVRTD